MLCDNCQKEVTKVTFSLPDLSKGYCRDCPRGGSYLMGQSAAVIQDSIEGGLEIKHGLCNPDDTPRKFYSKSEIRRAAFEAGWTISGETPKPNPRLQDLRQR